MWPRGPHPGRPARSVRTEAVLRAGTLVAMAAQYIYTMRDLRRFYPPDREVLRGINLSFYPGAKIGVIGSNGSGKSSLLRIMAGEDDGFTGEARLTSGFTVGFLAQEPQLDPTKDVLGNVSEGVGEAKALVDRFNAVCSAMGEPDADFDKLLAEQGELQDKIDAAGAWDLDRTFEIAMDALGHVAQDILGGVELWLLGEEPDGEAAGQPGLAAEAVVLPGHDAQDGRLPRTVGSDDTDLRPRIEGEVDALEHLPVGRIEPPQVTHGVDVLGCHGDQCASPEDGFRPHRPGRWLRLRISGPHPGPRTSRDLVGVPAVGPGMVGR